MKYQGFNPELEKLHQSEEDWVFGGSSAKCLAIISEEEREKYLPQGEVQRGEDDTMDCASRGPINILEAKFSYLVDKNLISPANKQWLTDNGYLTNGKVEFSDAFIAILSGTTEQGNSMKAPLEAIRKNGLIPKKLLPLDSTMTFAEYHNPERITGSMLALGQQFIKHFTINYERVDRDDFVTLLMEDLIDVAGYAWPDPIDGVYPRTEKSANHVWVNFKNKYFAFDNYLDEHREGDFIKQLASDYDFVGYGYRLYISEGEVKTSNWLWDLIQAIITAILDLFPKQGALTPEQKNYFLKQIALLQIQLANIIAKMPPETEAGRKLFLTAISCLGKDMAFTQGVYGCAEAVNAVHTKAFGGPIGGELSTYRMNEALTKSPKFYRLPDNTKHKPGDVIISPSGWGNGRIANGHVGIFGENNVIMSNNSSTYLWDKHLTYDQWLRYYVQSGGFPCFIYRPQ